LGMCGAWLFQQGLVNRQTIALLTCGGAALWLYLDFSNAIAWIGIVLGLLILCAGRGSPWGVR